MDKKTQNQLILSHLLKGHSLTPIDALKLFGCFRLGARVWDLKRQGHDIKTERVEVGEGKRVARYSLQKA